MPRGGKRFGAGRKPGPVPKNREGIEAFAKSVVEDVEVQALLLAQARKGTLPAPLYQLFFHYAYGRPREQQVDDHALMADLVGAVLQHVDSREGRAEIRAILEKHAAGPPGLRAVA